MISKNLDIKMNTSIQSPRDRVKVTKSKATKIIAGMLLISSIQVVNAQSIGCNTVRNAQQARVEKAKTAVLASSDNSNLVLKNAMSCLDRVMKILNAIAIPGLDMTGLTMETVVNFLGNKACKVIVDQVGVAAAPILQLSNDAQKALDGAVAPINTMSKDVSGEDLIKGSASGSLVNAIDAGTSGVMETVNAANATIAANQAVSSSAAQLAAANQAVLAATNSENVYAAEQAKAQLVAAQNAVAAAQAQRAAAIAQTSAAASLSNQSSATIGQRLMNSWAP